MLLLPLCGPVVLLLAAWASAAPGKRASIPNLTIGLASELFPNPTVYNASTDGTQVFVVPDTMFEVGVVKCLPGDEVPLPCLPEYHCFLFNKTHHPVVTLRPGVTFFPKTQVGRIDCHEGPAPPPAAPAPTAPAAPPVPAAPTAPALALPTAPTAPMAMAQRADGDGDELAARSAVEPGPGLPDGYAVFANDHGVKLEAAFKLGETIVLVDGAWPTTLAGVQRVKVAITPVWKCEAYTQGAASLGIFWSSQHGWTSAFEGGSVESFKCSR